MAGRGPFWTAVVAGVAGGLWTVVVLPLGLLGTVMSGGSITIAGLWWLWLPGPMLLVAATVAITLQDRQSSRRSTVQSSEQASPSPPTAALSLKIKRLADLRDVGLLTEAEFRDAVDRLLDPR